MPGPIRRFWAALFATPAVDTHGSAHFGTAATGARLRARHPAQCPRNADRRFWQDGHILTCAPTGTGKGLGGVIPNLLDYPGSALVLDFKGENLPSRPARAASWARM